MNPSADHSREKLVVSDTNKSTVISPLREGTRKTKQQKLTEYFFIRLSSADSPICGLLAV